MKRSENFLHLIRIPSTDVVRQALIKQSMINLAQYYMLNHCSLNYLEGTYK